MEYRKLISFGKNSFVISIPKNWIRQSKLKKGDLVYLSEDGSNLLLQPRQEKNDEEKEIVIEVDGKELKQLKREIIGAYIQNYKTIHLKGAQIKDKAKDLQAVIQHLVALEVMEQTSKEIIAKDFLNIDSVSVKTVVRKIDNIIRSMFEDCENMLKEDTYESINHRDSDVNKLTFLMFRIVRYGLENPSYMLKKFSLTSLEMLSLWWLSHELESIADEIKRIARYLQSMTMEKKKQELYVAIFRRVRENYAKMIKAYHEQDIQVVHEVINTREEFMDVCEKFFNENRNIDGLALLMHRTKSLIVHINHLGRVLYQ